MSLTLYNTLTRQKEVFKPRRADEVKLYYCGPTPYNYAHIGNLRGYLFSDLITRSLRFLWYNVKTVMNVTDIDDKTIRDSQKAGKNLKEYTEFYTQAFLEDIDHIHIRRADTIAPISLLVDEMITLIQRLLDTGYAYLADDNSIYYSVAKFSHYGELANLDMKGMISSVRINNDEYEKEQVADFTLWKAYDPEKDGPNRWDATFQIDGKTVSVSWRPGWHIECSACNMRFFWEQIDLHLGGIDNIFPHHQNEIAQTEAITGKEFAKYWMHCDHLLVDNKKMAKSAGNFYTLRDIVTEMQKRDISLRPETIYRAFRLMSLQSRYRESFNFTFDRLISSLATIRNIDKTMKRLGRYTGNNVSWVRKEMSQKLDTVMGDFIAVIEEDFNSPEALVLLFDFLSYVNTQIDTRTLTLSEKNAITDFLRSIDTVFAILDFSLLESRLDIPDAIQDLLQERTDAKARRDFARADIIRGEIERQWYRIIDEAQGSHVEKVE